MYQNGRTGDQRNLYVEFTCGQIKLTIGNCGFSRATVDWAARAARVRVPAATAELQATRETRIARRSAKTFFGQKNFIS